MGYFSNLFRFPNATPDNFEIVIRRAMEIHCKLDSDNIKITGASANYERKKKWGTNPKLTVIEVGVGKNNYEIEKPTTPTQSKFLIAILYSLCHINNCIDNAHLFYNDKHGKPSSIATRHGPEHSEYMQNLIAKLQNKEFIEKLFEEFRLNYPDDLNEVERTILDLTKKNELSVENTTHILKIHKIKATQLNEIIENLTRRENLDPKFIPNIIRWPMITLIDYELKVQDEISKNSVKLKEKNSVLKRKIDHLSNQNQNLEIELSEIKRMSLFKRIFRWSK